MTPKNLQRAANAEKVISNWLREASNKKDPAEIYGAIVNCLTDVQHLCEKYGLNYADILRWAEWHYNFEKVNV